MLQKIPHYLLITCLISVCTFAQKRKPLSTYQDIQKDFDIKTSKLPAHYKGHSAAVLYEVIRNLRPEKSEYETTENFNIRMAAYRSVLTKHLYAFRIEDKSSPVRYGNNFDMTYNADTQSLTIKINAYSSSGDTGIINLKNFYKRKSTIATNAFGAKVKVSMLYGIGYHLFYWSKIKPVIEIKMPPSIARNIKIDIDILLIGKPTVADDTGDIIDSRYFEKEATFTSPEATAFDSRYICVDLLSIWVFNKRTGDILAKLNMQPQGDDKELK